MASSILTGANNIQPSVRNGCPVNELPLYYAECAKNPHMDFTDKMKYEIIRYSTFSNYMKNSSISFMKLSRAGFYYDVFSESVRCFKCKYIYNVHNYSNEDPMEIHYKESPNCNFVRENYDASQRDFSVARENTDCPEVIGGAAGGSSDLRHSESFPTHVVTMPKTTLLSTNAMTHSSENLSVVTENQESRISSSSLGTSLSQPRAAAGPKNSSQTRQKTRDIFNGLGICIEKPISTKYAILATRLASFKTWPKSAIVSPDQLARAGFYYDGSKDQVQCFFCGGRLAEWEAGDEPWTEHAQWFPNCAFVNQCKGTEFITQTHGQKREANKWEEEFWKSSAFQSLLGIGYTREQIKHAYSARSCKESRLSADHLLELILELEEKNQQGCSHNGNLDKQNKNLCTVKEGEANERYDERKMEKLKKCKDLDVEELILEHQKLKDQSLCKICMDDDALVVLLPCGHMCTCVHCAPAMRKCPICREFVKGTIKAILS